MKTWTPFPGATRALFVLAAAAVFAPVQAQDGGGTAPLTTAPESSISVGVSATSGNEKDRARFGLFNGLRDHDTNGLLGFGYYNRDPASGRWIGIEGRNLGLDNRELGLSYRQLGDFRVNVDYSELVRHDPRTINTSLTGAGTTTPTVSLLATPGTGSELNLELKRKGLGLDLMKEFGAFQLEVTFKNEDKTGARLFGRGFACSANYTAAGVCGAATTATAILMLPEPVDSTIRQFDAKLNYSGDKLKLSGGYYGNFYTNNNGNLTPTILGATYGTMNGGTAAWDANFRNYMQTPMALWPDSQSHQFFLGGNYALTPKTRLNFKYSYTHATQNESFTGMGLNPIGPLTATRGGTTRDSLGGILNTTKMQVGFSSHPWDKVHVHGDVSYVSKKNQTPIDYYNVHVATGPVFNTWTNGNQSPKDLDAKLEVNQQLPSQFLLTGGVKYINTNYGTFTSTDVAGGILAIRQKLETYGYRIELRKTMSETFSGAVAVLNDRRIGNSPYLKVNSLPLTGVFEASDNCASVGANACVWSRTGAIPYMYEDLQRQKIRLNANWTPLERLSLQIFWDNGNDRFRGPVISGGTTYTKNDNVTLDASYELSENWKFSGYWTRSQQQTLHGHSSDYQGLIKDRSDTIGAGFTGTPFARFRIGGDLISMQDTLRYTIIPDALISAGNLSLFQQTGGLPDVKYNLLRLKLYGEYAVQKNATVRVDYIYNRTKFDEWAYDGLNNGKPFLFSDNTTISAKQLQSVNFIGASYIYKFQ
jgi:MtrB/PioB family decaheme-associated outer membrane protein